MTRWAGRIRTEEIARGSLSGEVRLWYELIVDAVNTVRNYPATHPLVLRDRAWLNGADAPLRCADICGALGLDPQAVTGSLYVRAVHRIPTPRHLREWHYLPARGCRECGVPFLPKFPQHVFCSPAHKKRAQRHRNNMRKQREVA